MNTVAIMSLYRFPLWADTLEALEPLVDEFYLLLDRSGPVARTVPPPGDRMSKAVKEKTTCFFTLDVTWNRYNWREKLLGAVNHFSTPDIVIALDEDERFSCGPQAVQKELDDFWASDKKAMMFSYHAPLPTCDGEIVFDGKPYPRLPHMKAYKWEPGLTYVPYHGYAQVSNYTDPSLHWEASTQIYHYCCWTPEMRKREFMW